MTWPHTRRALKTYLRADAPLVALIGNRTFFGVPARGVKYPLVTLPGQVGGGQDLSMAPIDLPLHQLDIFGAGLSTEQVDELAAVESAVRDALAAICMTTVGSTVLCGVNVVSVLDGPDESNRPRRVLTLEVSAAATAA